MKAVEPSWKSTSKITRLRIAEGTSLFMLVLWLWLTLKEALFERELASTQEVRKYIKLDGRKLVAGLYGFWNTFAWLNK